MADLEIMVEKFVSQGESWEKHRIEKVSEEEQVQLMQFIGKTHPVKDFYRYTFPDQTVFLWSSPFLVDMLRHNQLQT